MPILVNKNVFRLQVSVDDVDAVEVGEGSDGFSDVEEGCFMVEACVAPEIKDELNANFNYFRGSCVVSLKNLYLK